MNPPPLPPQYTLSMATIVTMLAIFQLLQGIFIGISAKVIKAYRGVLNASIAMFVLSTGHLIIARTGPPTIVQALLTNLLNAVGYFLIYLALCRFTNKSHNKLLVYGAFPLIIIVIIATGIFVPNGQPYVLLEGLAAGILFVFSGVIKLLSNNSKQYRLSANITAISLSVFLVALIIRLVYQVISLMNNFQRTPIPDILLFLATFILSYFWTGGFILMVNQRLQSNLNDLAMNDSLTRIHNRRAMGQILNTMLPSGQQVAQEFSIILLDIDHFKHVNDNHGHETGDKVLQWFVSLLQKSLRMNDVLSRWGGEEFLIVLPDTSLEDARGIAERLRNTIAASQVGLPEKSLRITFSAGISSSKTNQDVKSLCRSADKALYIAKQKRNQVVTEEALSTKMVAPNNLEFSNQA